MKNFLAIIVFLMMIIISSNLCSAYERNEYDNSPHYIFVTTSQGRIYLDLRTVNVHDYNPPHYQIAGEFIWVNGDKENRFEVVIRYNFDTKETYGRRDGYWTKSDVNGDSNIQKNNRKIADALFSAAYGMDFYGSSFEDTIIDYPSNEEIRKYTEQIKQNPNDYVAYNNRGSSYAAELGQYERAIRDFNKAIQLNPNYDMAYRNRGLTYFKLGQYERAIQDYNKAIQLNPNFADAYNNRGVAYDDLGKYYQAIQNYNKAVQLNPNDADYYYNRGITYEKIGKIIQAESDFAKARALGYND